MSGTSGNLGWRPHSVPGSIKPVFGARYPPLNPNAPSIASTPANPKVLSSSFKSPAQTAQSPEADKKFRDFDNSVKDAWDLGDESEGCVINETAAATLAEEVLARHAAARRHHLDPSGVMLNIHQAPSKNSKIRAMQLLATQREPLPGAGTAAVDAGGLQRLYPKLPTPSFPAPSRSKSDSTGDGEDGEKERTGDRTRFDRISAMLDPKLTPGVDLEKLKKECWKGIPHQLRPTAWRILSGYLPANAERREATLKRKRDEYFHYVEQYFHTRFDESHQDTFRQIHIDIPRMCPLVPLFQQKIVQELFERLLYIWAIRHPASGYVQGINDLVTPFFVVFLSEFVRSDMEVGTYDVSEMSREALDKVESDSFWCVSALLDSIQDNYTFAQPGIQGKVSKLHHLMSRVDNSLHHHLEQHQVDYLQFSFRWMNNLLMREIPLRATIRLWDTYMSERGGFADFHVYVCAAFLRIWSKQLQQQKDFQNIMLLLQNLPTQGWSDQQICELTADAFSLMSLFAGAKNHLTSSG